MFVLSIFINIGMWFERFVIIATSLHRDFLPSAGATSGRPSWTFFTFTGTFGLFLTLFLLFIRFVPMIAASEVKGVMAAQNHRMGGSRKISGGGALSLRDLFVIDGRSRTEVLRPVAEFDDDRKLVAAARAAREFGYTRMDAYSPFPGAWNRRSDRHSAVAARVSSWLSADSSDCYRRLFLIWWTGAIDYPLVIGGKPLFALVPSIPIMFELTILFSAFSAVLGMFALNKLPQFYHPVFNFSRFEGATDDKFLLAIEASDPVFNPDETALFLTRLGATNAELVEA